MTCLWCQVHPNLDVITIPHSMLWFMILACSLSGNWRQSVRHISDVKASFSLLHIWFIQKKSTPKLHHVCLLNLQKYWACENNTCTCRYKACIFSWLFQTKISIKCLAAMIKKSVVYTKVSDDISAFCTTLPFVKSVIINRELN